MPLTDTAIRSAKPLDKPRKLTDAQGLYLLVKPNGSKHWYLKYRFEGKERKLAFGPYPDVSLAQARKFREEARSLLGAGTDPGLIKKQGKTVHKKDTSFEVLARQWVKTKKGWSQGHTGRSIRAMELHLFPHLGKSSVASLKTTDLLVPLLALEEKGYQETAMRMQQRIAAIMRYAVRQGIITRNPASDLTDAIAPPQTRHYPALPLEKLTDFLTRIGDYRGRLLTRLAVQLNLLIFIRSSELRFARWPEIDLEEGFWTIPAEREAIPGVRYSERGAKMKTPHLVPLSTQAIALLKQLKKLSSDEVFLFPGDHDLAKPMSENTINKALRVMGYDTKTDVCGHGFRAMACSALIESGLWTEEAVEKQMSHQERNNVRAPYSHLTKHLEQRVEMMQWWADYLDANRGEYIAPYIHARQCGTTESAMPFVADIES
ncbi:TPA: integrase arm-type DNA-binding domain-containing protein [Enterobacter hormaechei subsp. steigerwaltii]|nr:integrase arm-type DNA-binding domain-containing protein [Enterobacter hormaechei subsp. steigerwaltii]